MDSSSSQPLAPAISSLPSFPSSSSITLAQTSTSSNRNPISLRLWKVLGNTSFDDPSSREALDIVNERYCSQSSSSGPSTRINGGALGARASAAGTSELDDPRHPRSRRTLSSSNHPKGSTRTDNVTGEAAVRARLMLKKDLEDGLADGGVRFVKAFGKVDEKLQSLHAHVTKMKSRLHQIESDLSIASASTSSLLSRTSLLSTQQSSAELRAVIVKSFIELYTLTQEEVMVLGLEGREVGIEMGMLDGMEKMLRIRRDCRSLFAFVGEGDAQVGGGAGKKSAEEDAGNQVLIGTEIMALTSTQLESAYLKLHKYLVFEFRKFTRDASLEVSVLTRRAVARLRDREGLLSDALEILNATRQSSVLQSFLDALTRGGPGGLPRPIELHAHDPTRYVGDMLAWVHQTTAGEREFLDALFDIKSQSRRMVGQARDVSSENAEEVIARKCLDRHLEGLARPLKARIQHTAKSQEAIIMAYKLTNLVQFYLVTMERTIGVDAHLTKTLRDIHEVVNGAFLDTLEAQGRSLLRFLHPPDANLTPPLALRESSHTLHQIMSVYDTSLVDESDREADFAKILEAAVGPLLEMCKRMAAMRPKGTEWEKHIFLVNCFQYVDHVLEAYPFTFPRRQEINSEMTSCIASLINAHTDLLLAESGISTLVKASESHAEDVPLSRTPAAEPKAVIRAMKDFEAFLQSLSMLPSPRLLLLSSSRLATEIHRGGLERLSSAYAGIHRAVMDKGNKYEFASTLLPRGVDEVATLLGVDSAYE